MVPDQWSEEHGLTSIIQYVPCPLFALLDHTSASMHHGFVGPAHFRTLPFPRSTTHHALSASSIAGQILVHDVDRRVEARS